jgi:hypothetical protein
MSATILEQEVKHEAAIPEFKGDAGKALAAYYSTSKVAKGSTAEKIVALQSNLGRFEFSAYGGEETEEMTLRAAERVYLLQQKIPIE